VCKDEDEPEKNRGRWIRDRIKRKRKWKVANQAIARHLISLFAILNGTHIREYTHTHIYSARIAAICNYDIKVKQATDTQLRIRYPLVQFALNAFFNI